MEFAKLKKACESYAHPSYGIHFGRAVELLNNKGKELGHEPETAVMEVFRCYLFDCYIRYGFQILSGDTPHREFDNASNITLEQFNLFKTHTDSLRMQAAGGLEYTQARDMLTDYFAQHAEAVPNAYAVQDVFNTYLHVTAYGL